MIDKNSGRELSATLGKLQAGNDVPGKAKMVAGGHTITIIPKSELDNWKRASAGLSIEVDFATWTRKASMALTWFTKHKA